MRHEVEAVISDPKLFAGWWQTRQPEALDAAIKNAAVDAGLIHVGFGMLALTDKGAAFRAGKIALEAQTAPLLAAGQTWRTWRSERTIIDVIGEIIFYTTPDRGEFWCSRAAWEDWQGTSGARLIREDERQAADHDARGQPEAGEASGQPGGGEPPLHPDDIAVEEFGFAMREKLAEARQKGRSGWQRISERELWRRLSGHVLKRDPVDVANFAMFLWFVHKPGEVPAPIPEMPHPGTAAEAKKDGQYWANMLNELSRERAGVTLSGNTAAVIAALLRRAYDDDTPAS